MNRRSLVFPAVLIAGCKSIPDRRKPEVRIAVGGRAALDFMPVYLASSLGFYRQEGVAVTIQDLASGSKALGLRPEDVRAAGVGVNFSMVAALEHGQVDAAVAGPLGMAILSKNARVRVLADCRNASGAESVLGTSNLPFGALMVVPKWARTHLDVVQRVGRATRRALRWIRAHPPQDVSNAMPQQYKGQDPAVYLTGVSDIQSAFSEDGLMPPEGPEHVLEMLKASEPRLITTRVDFTATYTNEFMRDR